MLNAMRKTAVKGMVQVDLTGYYQATPYEAREENLSGLINYGVYSGLDWTTCRISVHFASGSGPE
jgi:hypothetical protein